ncbi:MAG: AMP-binding protein [Sphingomonas paucimobilis]
MSQQPNASRVTFAPRAVDISYRHDGTMLWRSPIPLDGCRNSMCDYIVEWAERAPDRPFVAQRDDSSSWRVLTYGELWQQARGLGEALLAEGLDRDRPIAILTGNSIEHALLTFAGMVARIPVAPISPAYSAQPEGRARLAGIVDLLQPGLAFVQSHGGFDHIRTLPALADIRWVCAQDVQDLSRTPAGDRIARALANATPDDVAKILFTSGSTGEPKGVPQTQRMLCSAIRATQLLGASEDEPVIVDWMPWHHTMGGNQTLGSTLRDGGTIYIDQGRPAPGAFAHTIANLREIAVTSAINVPGGLQMLAAAMEGDEGLRHRFFSRIGTLASAGAALPDDVRDRLQSLARVTLGREIDLITAYGTTETGPGISITHWASRAPAEIGLPVPGMTVKLIPVGDRYEIRVRGANVMTGYFKRPDLDATVFDEEGYYKVGDAGALIDPHDPRRGLRFAGRLGENFKLTNGTWVLVGELRGAILAAAPTLQDVVIAGHDRDDVRVIGLVKPAVRAAAIEASGGADAEPELRDRVTAELMAYNRDNTGATRRVAAFALLDRPLSLGAGEVTDKGNINQRAILRSEAALVDALYAVGKSDRVVRLDGSRTVRHPLVSAALSKGPQ